ncbi:hypothetical protein DPMN_125939 [Dreissena polymorpha]|uniref:Uncharacterized protein n=1 Tax=Dreissena polymorpha TaxID=45954 RepID=A0A9D4GZ49_DREPO|nr:hypothetical protein DPMN_125939 [Dreissena polymorpha]
MKAIILSGECQEIYAIQWDGENASVGVVGVAFVEDYAVELNSVVWTKIGDIMVQVSRECDSSNRVWRSEINSFPNRFLYINLFIIKYTDLITFITN